MRNSTTPRFSANTAGRNCTFANHPNHTWSRKIEKQQGDKRKTDECSCKSDCSQHNKLFLDSLLFYVAKIVKGNGLQLTRITD